MPFTQMLEVVVVLAVLAVIPAALAAKKGRSFGAWWFYGFLLFPIALIHAAAAGAVPERIERRRMETEARFKCPHCAELIKIEAKVCPFCRCEVPAESMPRCRQCQGIVLLGAKSCPHCGVPWPTSKRRFFEQ